MTERVCGAKKKQGAGACQRPAGWGTGHPGSGRCKLHGGASPSGTKAARREEAERAVVLYGLPREVDPHTALLEELHRTAGHVQWLAAMIGAGELAAAENPTGRRRGVRLDQSTIAGDVPSVWVALYQQERKHLADVAKTCIAVGIEERKVRLLEDQAQAIAELMRGFTVRLGLDPAAPEVREAMRDSLTLIAGGRAA